MIKLQKFSIPTGTPLNIHIKSNKENFDAIISYDGHEVNTVVSEILTLHENEVEDGTNIECVVDGFTLVRKDNANEKIYDFSDKKTIFKKETFIDIEYDNSQDKQIVKFKFYDLMINQTSRFPDEFKHIFDRRNHFKGILHDDGSVIIVRYASLHEHSTYSLDDAINKVETIAEVNEYYAALSDHGNMYGTLKFNKEMVKRGKKPIFGFEGYIEDFDEDIKFFTHQEFKNEDEESEYKKKHCNRRHILFLAKNDIGLKNLMKLTTEGHLFKYNRPHIRYDVLDKYHEGIICTSACFGGTLPKALLTKNDKLVHKYIEQMISWFGKEDFYIEIQRHETEEMLIERVKQQPVKLQDLKKMNISVILDSLLTDSVVNQIIKDLHSEFVTNKDEVIDYVKKLYKNYTKNIKKMSINQYIDFICSISSNLYHEKNNFLKILNFETDKKYFDYENDKKLISDVLFHYEEKYVNEMLIKLANQYGLKVIATTDSHYTKPEDSFLHELWLCRQGKKNIDSPDRRRFPGEHYELASSEQMVELFKDIPEALDNTLEIAEKCNVNMNHEGYYLPDFPLPKGFKTQLEYFKYLCSKGYAERFKGTPKYKDKKYLDRMNFEIGTIEKMGFPSYFLIVQDFIKWAQDDKVAEHPEIYFPEEHYNLDEIPDLYKAKDFKIYIGPGRGSAAGSLVAYCLGITQIDPIDFDLLFERFLNPSRISMPDIDTDIDDELRHHVFNYTRVKYGYEHTSRIITFSTAKPKAAVGIVQRVANLPLDLKDRVCDTILNTPKTSFKSSFKESVEFRDIYESDEQAKKVIDYAMKYEDLVTGVSQHACGFLITPNVVTDYVPQILLKDKQGIYQLTTQWDKDECEEMGALKMDYLGLRTLSLIRNSLHYVNRIREKNGEKPIDMYDIPLYDKNVYKFIATGDTGGVFQIESSGMKNLMVQLYKDVNSKTFTGREGFNRLSAAIALYRPGPMDEIGNYLNNMAHPDEIVYETPQIKNRLSDTYNVIVYQEQAMLLCRDMAGFSEGQADKVRKGMAKKVAAILTEYREYFIYGSADKNIKGCIHNGIDEQVAISIWEKMEKFGSYAFNKSHSVAYAFLVVYTAWLSTYYPNIYLSALLNSFVNNADRLQIYLNLAREKNIQILPPDINRSDKQFVPDGSNVRMGLQGIKGVKATAGYIIEEREKNGNFRSLIDLMERMMKSGHEINKSNMEALIYSGAIDSIIIPATRQAALNCYKMATDKLSCIKTAISKKQMTIFDFVESSPRIGNDYIKNYYDNLKEIVIEKADEIEKQELLKKEKEYTGIYITEHPLDEYMEILNKEAYISIDTFLPEKTEDAYGNMVINFSEMAIRKRSVKIAGVITVENTFYTKKDSKPLSVFTIEDKTGSVECVAFEDVRKNCVDLIKEDSIVAVEGKLQVRDERTQLIVSSIIPIESVGNKTGIESIVVEGPTDKNDARKAYSILTKIVNKHKASPKDFPTTITFMFGEEYNRKAQIYKTKVKWSNDLRNELSQYFTNVHTS